MMDPDSMARKLWTVTGGDPHLLRMLFLRFAEKRSRATPGSTPQYVDISFSAQAGEDLILEGKIPEPLRADVVRRAGGVIHKYRYVLKRLVQRYGRG